MLLEHCGLRWSNYVITNTKGLTGYQCLPTNTNQPNFQDQSRSGVFGVVCLYTVNQCQSMLITDLETLLCFVSGQCKRIPTYTHKLRHVLMDIYDILRLLVNSEPLVIQFGKKSRSYMQILTTRRQCSYKSVLFKN